MDLKCCSLIYLRLGKGKGNAPKKNAFKALMLNKINIIKIDK